MAEVGKVYRLAGTGSPLIDRQILLVSMLIDCGFRLSTSRKNFQDTTAVGTGHRSWVILFEGSSQIPIDGQTYLCRQVADYLTGDTPKPPPGKLADYAQIYSDEPGTAPLRALEDITAREDIREVHRQLLHDLKAMPRHLEIQRGGRRYWIPADLSEEQREAAIMRLDRA